MESKFKIGELVKVVDYEEVCSLFTKAAIAMNLPNWEFRNEALATGETAIVMGVYFDGEWYAGIYVLKPSGKSFVIKAIGLESLDNPPKPKKELTHMVVFRAIHAGLLPSCIRPSSLGQSESYLQNNWSVHNDLSCIKHFVTLTGETKTIEEVTKRFGK